MVAIPSDRAGGDLVARVRHAAASGVVAIAALALACNLGALAVPLFNMQVFNRVLPTRDLRTLWSLAAGTGIVLLTWAALEALRAAAQEVLAARFAAQLAAPILAASAAAKRPDCAAAESLADLETLRSFLSGRASLAPFDIVWSPVLLLVLLALHWSLALLAFACLLTLLGMNLLGDALSRRALLAANEATATAFRQAADGVNAAEAVLALGMLPLLAARWQAGQRRAAGLVHRAVLRARAIAAATSALRLAMTGGMVALGLILALSGMASSGSMVAGNMILARILMPFTTIAATRRQWIDALAAWRRLQAAFADPAPRRYDDALPAPAPVLTIENLLYIPAGGDRPLLRSLSFSVMAGEAVAIIGPSSAGKSTLLRLIVGMAKPTSGGIYLDGTSTFLWEREDLARHVGYVPQRPVLLEASVADNIARMQVPDVEAVVRAARRAGVHRVIASLPRGYASRIVGNLLSGGQRQRLALARALYRDPKVLLLDEPTAFLDADGEAELAGLLAALRKEGVTLVVVTHRPSLLKAVDKVLVLRDGMVAQFGPPSEVESSVSGRPFRLISARTEPAES